MSRFGKTLDEYFRIYKFSKLQINQIGIQIIDILEKLHSLGYVYNDMKGNNICVGMHGEQSPGLLKLIDFGLCTRYLDSKGDHIKLTTTKFKGNPLFASPMAMNYYAPSRRDDLIALFYFLAYLTSDKFPFEF